MRWPWLNKPLRLSVAGRSQSLRHHSQATPVNQHYNHFPIIIISSEASTSLPPRCSRNNGMRFAPMPVSHSVASPRGLLAVFIAVHMGHALVLARSCARVLCDWQPLQQDLRMPTQTLCFQATSCQPPAGPAFVYVYNRPGCTLGFFLYTKPSYRVHVCGKGGALR